MSEALPHPAPDVICPYCDGQAVLVTGARIYPHRRDLYGKHFYLCDLCNAYVGCHPGTCTPLGTPANGKTRRARRAVHDKFDQLWRSGRMTRGTAYRWLCVQMDMSQEDCHIGRFTDAQCAQALACVELKLSE